MVDYGPLPDGTFRRKPLSVIWEEINEKQRADISTSLDVSEGSPQGQINMAFARQIDPLWGIAEQLHDAVYLVAGVRPKAAQVPKDALAQDFPDPSIERGGFLDLFGRPERQTSCECERRPDVSLVQALNLLNGSTIAEAIADSEGRIAKLILGGAADRRIVEEIYALARNHIRRRGVYFRLNPVDPDSGQR